MTEHRRWVLLREATQNMRWSIRFPDELVKF